MIIYSSTVVRNSTLNECLFGESKQCLLNQDVNYIPRECQCSMRIERLMILCGDFVNYLLKDRIFYENSIVKLPEKYYIYFNNVYNKCNLYGFVNSMFRSNYSRSNEFVNLLIELSDIFSNFISTGSILTDYRAFVATNETSYTNNSFEKYSNMIDNLEFNITMYEKSLSASSCVMKLEKLLEDFTNCLLEYRTLNQNDINFIVSNEQYKLYSQGMYKYSSFYSVVKDMVNSGYIFTDQYVNLLVEVSNIFADLSVNVTGDILGDFQVLFNKIAKHIMSFNNKFEKQNTSADQGEFNNIFRKILINSIDDGELKVTKLKDSTEFEDSNESLKIGEACDIGSLSPIKKTEDEFEKNIESKLNSSYDDIISNLKTIVYRKNSCSDSTCAGSDVSEIDISIESIDNCSWSMLIEMLDISTDSVDMNFVKLFLIDILMQLKTLNINFSILEQFGVYNIYDLDEKSIDEFEMKNIVKTFYGFFDVSELLSLMTIMGDVHKLMSTVLNDKFLKMISDESVFNSAMKLVLFNYVGYLSKDCKNGIKCFKSKCDNDSGMIDCSKRGCMNTFISHIASEVLKGGF